MDKFFTQKYCDRCGKKLTGGRIMSMYNTECICMDCYTKEKKRSDYNEAKEADINAYKSGNANFKGIGMKRTYCFRKPTIEVDLSGPNGNIYSVIARAKSAMKEANISKELRDKLQERVYASDSYEEALDIISEYVNLDKH